MTAFTPKTYQTQVLESVEAYFKACHELPSPADGLYRDHRAPVGARPALQPAGRLSARHAVFLPARADRRRQDLAGGEERGAGQYASAAQRAQRDPVAGASASRSASRRCAR